MKVLKNKTNYLRSRFQVANKKWPKVKTNTKLQLNCNCQDRVNYLKMKLKNKLISFDHIEKYANLTYYITDVENL